MSNSYELVYFDGRGRGEQIRLAFTATGVKYTDTRIAVDDWPKVKPDAPQGRLPYLIINGKEKLSQSLAILRYVGKQHDLYGSGKMEPARIDEVIDTCVDLMEKWEKAFFAKGDDKEAANKKFNEEDIPLFYKMLEDLLKVNAKNGYAVGAKLSIADCTLYNTIDVCGEDKLKGFPSLEANRKKVKPVFEAYLKTRKGQF